MPIPLPFLFCDLDVFVKWSHCKEIPRSPLGTSFKEDIYKCFGGFFFWKIFQDSLENIVDVVFCQ